MKSNEPVLKLVKQEQGYWERFVKIKVVYSLNPPFLQYIWYFKHFQLVKWCFFFFLEYFCELWHGALWRGRGHNPEWWVVDCLDAGIEHVVTGLVRLRWRRFAVTRSEVCGQHGRRELLRGLGERQREWLKRNMEQLQFSSNFDSDRWNPAVFLAVLLRLKESFETVAYLRCQIKVGKFSFKVWGRFNFFKH